MKDNTGIGYGIGNQDKIREQIDQRFRENYRENNEFSQAGRNPSSAVRSKSKSAGFLESRSPDDVKFFDNQFARENTDSIENLKWLTPIEARRLLRVSKSSLKAYIYRGKLRPHKLGRLNRFLKEDVERLITLPNSNRR